jgi:hypothetical protein
MKRSGRRSHVRFDDVDALGETVQRDILAGEPCQLRLVLDERDRYGLYSARDTQADNADARARVEQAPSVVRTDRNGSRQKNRVYACPIPLARLQNRQRSAEKGILGHSA